MSFDPLNLKIAFILPDYPSIFRKTNQDNDHYFGRNRLFQRMEMLHERGICDLTIDSYVKIREKHDGATGFL